MNPVGPTIGSFVLPLIVVLAFGIALAEEMAVVKVETTAQDMVIGSKGVLLVAQIGDIAILECDVTTLRRLVEKGVAFEVLMWIEPGEELFLILPQQEIQAPILRATLIEFNPGQYLLKVRSEYISEVEKLPYPRVRLVPAPILAKGTNLPPPRFTGSRACIEDIVGNVCDDTLFVSISRLSGREPVLIGGKLDTLLTRYSYSWRCTRAARYIYERFQNYGLEVAYHDYIVAEFALYSASFVDARYGWVVGSASRIYRTIDGGNTWTGQQPDSSVDLWGVCFIDTSRGWCCGTAGRVFRTCDGGETWVKTSSPVGSTLRDICFLDSLRGWVVGTSGRILRTSDGGSSWQVIQSGTSSNLYGCDFCDSATGWACGARGTILLWDGESWQPAESSTSEYLLDVDFVDRSHGWICGSGATILKTSDGGVTWFSQDAPANVNPYFKGVSFVDTLEGWIVGLGGTVLHTSDGGVTWEVQESGTLFGLRCVRFMDRSTGWAVGYGGTILHTQDGSLWENQRCNLPSGSLRYLKNVVATKPGQSSQEEVIICAHYDCTSDDPYNLAPGADDNATGTAAVLEAARVMAPYPFLRTIRFICFSGEEQGIYGSGEHVAEASKRGDPIVAVLNLDMIGYVDESPEDLDLIGNPSSEWLVDLTVACAQAYVPSLLTHKVIDGTLVYSDHYSFWRAGYDALCAIEDAEINYPYYHTTCDTLGNLTIAFTADATRAAIATVCELAIPDTTSSFTEPRVVPARIVVSPNPAIEEVKIRIIGAPSQPEEILIYDIKGQLVGEVAAGAALSSSYEIDWDACEIHDAALSPGIYFVVVRLPEETLSAKVVVLR